jgi:hypothetical protein
MNNHVHSYFQGYFPALYPLVEGGGGGEVAVLLNVGYKFWEQRPYQTQSLRDFNASHSQVTSLHTVLPSTCKKKIPRLICYRKMWFSKKLQAELWKYVRTKVINFSKKE